MGVDTKPIASTLESLLAALGVQLPVEFLSRLSVEEFLDGLDGVASLAPGERQRLADLLHAAFHITPHQFDDAVSEQQREHRNLADVLVTSGALTQREKDVVREFQLRRSSAAAPSAQTALGNILVANHQITRTQLEDALRRQVASGRRLGEELIHAGHVSKDQVNGGLQLQRKLIAYALAFLVGLAPLAATVPSAQAGQASSTMTVSATVTAEAKMQTLHQAAQLKITETHVARGYVEVQAASRFSVSTDSPAGFSMEFHPVGNIFDSVQVVGLGRPFELGAEGGTMILRGPQVPNQIHDLNYRFMLRPGTQPGDYPWPLQLSVRPLSRVHRQRS